MNLSYTTVIQTIYGNMLINRFDKNQTEALLKTGAAYDREKVEVAAHVCRQARPGGIMLDIGANFGTFALACATALKPLGGIVHAYEGQRILSYMLAGSAALNSMENLFVHHACVGDSTNMIEIPRFDYYAPMNFGSVEFGERQREPLDQKRQESTEFVKQVRIDDLDFDNNICFVKIDVEGMEESVLNGCIKTLERAKPVMLIEYLKSDARKLAEFIHALDYVVYVYNGDFLCIPKGKTVEKLNINIPEYTNGMKLESILRE